MNKQMRIAGIAAILFGLVTLFSGGMVLFGPENARAAAGDYVPFVVWFNFLSGFAYVAAGAGLTLGISWSGRAAAAIALAIAAVFVVLCVHVLSGGAHEVRTLFAMSLRLGFWAVIAITACNKFPCLPAGFSTAN